jgi:hypothetical protein
MLRRYGWTPTTRLLALNAAVFVLYNAYLLAAYVAHFPAQMSAEAHSYFRYNTHLGLLLMLTLLLLGRDIAAERGWRLAAAWRGVASPLLLGVAMLCPLALADLLRFDVEAPQLRGWQVATLAKSRLDNQRRLALILPGDNGSVTAMVEALLRFVPPAYPDLDLRVLTSLAPDTLKALAADGYTLAVVSCSGDAVAGRALLLQRNVRGWHTAAEEVYPAPRGHRWSHVLSYAPLCLVTSPGGD